MIATPPATSAAIAGYLFFVVSLVARFKNPEPIPETAEGRLLGHTNRGVQVYVAVMVR